MAEKGIPLEMDQHLLECPICLERLRQPKTLPCLHYFCQDCLGTYILKELSGKMESATSFPCPVCRKTITPFNQGETKDKWAEQFPTHEVIQEHVKLQEPSSEPLYCKPCQTKGSLTNQAFFFCRMMNASFCETCKLQHHDVIHNDCDIQDITTSEVIQHQHEKQARRCDIHGKKMVWFCENHKLLGCNICMIKDHGLCEKVKTATEYYHELKAEATQLAAVQVALKEGSEAMESLINEFGEQLKTMEMNHKTSLKSIENLRERINKRLDKLQKGLIDELDMVLNEEKRNIEAMSRQCDRLMKSMLHTIKSSMKAVEENDNIETILLYQKGQAEVNSCEKLFTKISKSFMSVSIKHEIAPDLVTLGDNALGKVVIEKQAESYGYQTSPLLGRRVKEIGKFGIKTPLDAIDCNARGVLYLHEDHALVSDSNNKKLKLFTDKGQYLDELVVEGYPCDLCQVDNDTVAVAVYSPGGVCVVKVANSKLSLLSAINMPMGRHCYGVTHANGQFVVGAGEGEVYSLSQGGVTNFLQKYSDICFSLTQDPLNEDTIVSVCCKTDGDYAVSRLPADKNRRDVIKAGVVTCAVGIDVDREGNIYVCGRDTNNVVQMSGDGTRVRELMTSSDGINKPWAISIRGDRFLITSVGRNDVHVFRLY